MRHKMSWKNIIKMEQSSVTLYHADGAGQGIDVRMKLKVNWDYNEYTIPTLDELTLINKPSTKSDFLYSLRNPKCPIDVKTVVDVKNNILAVDDLYERYNDVMVNINLDMSKTTFVTDTQPKLEGHNNKYSFQLDSVEVHENICIFMFSRSKP
jgi:hypothetical protein